MNPEKEMVSAEVIENSRWQPGRRRTVCLRCGRVRVPSVRSGRPVRNAPHEPGVWCNS